MTVACCNTMKKIDQLVFPKNLDKLLDEDGIWSDDTFDPITVTVMEGEADGEDVVCYQLEFAATGSFEQIETVMTASDMEGSGYDWEDLIREYIHSIDPIFENKLQSDSEGETCVLWVPDEPSFRKLLGHVLDLTGDPKTAKRLLE
jgi:hypothetical protein